ncbi:uncharacterized protein [Nicotiana sylvestris]|uniref:uncharacterized protein n=1 Tax=Nicotiana sylvestris TaxID=4096 RepID=UPI00388C5B2F
MVRRNGGIPKRGSSSKARHNDLCHLCGNSGHFIKDCPLVKQEQYKQNPDKAAKRNLVPDKRFSQKGAADNIVKQALAAWGDSSSESEREPDAENSSMMAVETEATKYDSLFALMAQSDDDEEDEDNEVNFRDVQRNLKSYSSKKLRSLANVLIDAYYSLDNNKEILTIELGEAEQSRDYLVVCAVDLNETIANLEKEKKVLNETIVSVENERDDLMVVVVDLKETIEGLSNEKHTLEKNIATTEQERDDFLVIITDLEETIEGINREHRTVSLGKGKEVASETHIKLEKELTDVKTSLCGELEKNRQLQAELEKVKIDLKKSLKWTWSSDVVIAMYFNNSGNRQGIVFQREKILTTLTRIMRGSGLQWTMDSRFSNHMTRSTTDFFSLKALQEGNVSFEKKDRYNLLSVSQICDKGNKVEFLSKVCTITNLATGKVVLVAKRNKNICVADFESLQAGDMRCLKSVDDDAELWHRRLGHASFSLLNELIQKDLVRGLPNSRFTWTLVLRTKDETFEVFMAFVKKFQVKIKLKVVCIRSDHGT